MVEIEENLLKFGTAHFSDFVKSITYFRYFTTSGRSKTVDNFMEMYDRLPIETND